MIVSKRIIMVKVDVDKSKEMAEGLESMPSFQLFKNGEKIREFSGQNDYSNDYEIVNAIFDEH